MLQVLRYDFQKFRILEILTFTHAKVETGGLKVNHHIINDDNSCLLQSIIELVRSGAYPWGIPSKDHNSRKIIGQEHARDMYIYYYESFLWILFKFIKKLLRICADKIYRIKLYTFLVVLLKSHNSRKSHLTLTCLGYAHLLILKVPMKFC